MGSASSVHGGDLLRGGGGVAGPEGGVRGRRRRPRGAASRPLGRAARRPVSSPARHPGSKQRWRAARRLGSSPARRPGSKQRRRQQVRSREQKRISRQQAKQKAASQRRLISQFDSTSLFPNWSSCNAHLFFLLKLDRLIECYIQLSFPLINCILHITYLISFIGTSGHGSRHLKASWRAKPQTDHRRQVRRPNIFFVGKGPIPQIGLLVT